MTEIIEQTLSILQIFYFKSDFCELNNFEQSWDFTKISLYDFNDYDEELRTFKSQHMISLNKALLD